jgi:quercetin dioxygenase-like cupin family protein
MRRWDLDSLPSAEGAPRVVVSTPEARIVLVDLPDGEELGEHEMRERTFVHVVRGEAEIEAAGEREHCTGGALVCLNPGERRTIRAVADTRLMLVLAPWPAPDHSVG